MIISPDQHLYLDGKYVWTPERVKEAWETSKREFAGWLQHCEGVKKLGRKPPRVYLMVGAPASGKSTWIEHYSTRINRSDLYFDACFDLPWKRQPFVEEALAMGCEVCIVWLDTPLAVCVERNAARSENRQVPEEVLRAMCDKIASNPPHEREGVSIIRVGP